MKTDSTMIVRDQLYIDGKWVKPAGTGTLDVINSSTEEVMARIPDGTPADVDRAVAAAQAAFPAWSQTPVAERAAMLQKLSAGLAARMDEIAMLVAQEVGMPLPLSKHDPGRAADHGHGLVRQARRGVPVRGAGRQLARRARAGRRGRLHHALELPAAPDRGQGGARARRRLHGGAQAERGGAAQRVRPGRDRAPGRPAGRRVQPGDRQRPGGRRGDRRASRRRHGVVHRLDARRQACRASSPRRPSSGSRSSSAASRRT